MSGPITLSTAGNAITAVVDASHGGRVASLRVDGTEVVVTHADRPIDWGLYPMAPFAGRLGHGAFEFDGVRHQLPLTLPPHAIHGTLVTRQWRTSAPGHMDVDLAPPWPFAGRVEHHVELAQGEDAITFTLALHAAEAMPATLGWHPWFVRRGGVLHLPATQMWERADDHLPTGRLVDVADEPWDDCFTGLRGAPAIVWPGAFTLTIDTDCHHVVAFTEPQHAICVEPQTGPPDAINLGCATIVEPGHPLTATMTLRFS